ncbi:MAG: hypothetical protein GX620_03365 [Chloroflexi bacterium]|mgnify:CR=1 FL=1|nr:hypothetical protein [Chloroflexota bacterium]
MTSKSDEERTVFNAPSARRLLKGGGKGLTEDERAMVVAMAEVDIASGAQLDEESRAILAKLKAGLKDYNVDELEQAIHRLVTAEPRGEHPLDWSDLKRSRRKKAPRKSSR